MQGATLRRPLRAWLSTIASGGAIACALGLMSLADAGNVLKPPEHVINLGIGPRANHQGAGNSIEFVAPAKPPATIATHAPSATQTLVSKIHVPVPDAPRLMVAVEKTPDPAQPPRDAASGDHKTSSTTTTTTTVPTAHRPPITLPGGGGVLDVGHPRKPRRPRQPSGGSDTPRKPRKPRTPGHPHKHKAVTHHNADEAKSSDPKKKQNESCDGKNGQSSRPKTKSTTHHAVDAVAVADDKDKSSS